MTSLTPVRPPAHQIAQEARPERLGLGGVDVQADDLPLPSVLTTTASIAATETMRPPSRTFS